MPTISAEPLPGVRVWTGHPEPGEEGYEDWADKFRDLDGEPEGEPDGEEEDDGINYEKIAAMPSPDPISPYPYQESEE